MIAPAHRFIVLVVISGAALALVMAPRRNEWFAIMRDEHRQADIIAQLEPRLAAGGVEAGLLATLARSHAELGHHQRAAELLERYLVLRPQDGEAHAELADLYRADGLHERRVVLLQRSLSLRRDMTRALELAGLYRDGGRFAEELVLLAEYEDRLSLAGGQLLRLAELRNASDDRQGALRTLLRPEVTTAPAPAMQPPAERLYLAELLVAADRYAEAVAWGKRWIVQWDEPWLATKMLQRIVHQLPPADAAELAEAIARQHPAVRFYLAGELAAAGEAPVARQLLAGWSRANPDPPATEVAAFVAACVSHNAPELTFAALAAAVVRHAPDRVIARYVDAVAAAFGPGALAPIWSSLPSGVIAANPLLAARLAWSDEDRALTRRLLFAIDPANLAGADRGMWLQLLMLAAAPREVFDILRQRRAAGPLPRELALEYARVAGALGQELAYRSAIADLDVGR